MSNDTKGHGLFWKVTVVVLIMVVTAQTAVMCYTLLKKENAPVVQVLDEDAVIRPRLSAPVQYAPQPAIQQIQSMVNPAPQGQALQPPPLPKLNIDPNGMPGITPAPQNTVTQSQSSAMQGPQGINMQRGFNMPQISMGMGGLIDVREEFERMQRLMDSMFSNQGMSAAMNRHSSARGLSMRDVAPTLREEGPNYVVKLTIPGLDKSEVNAEVNDNILTLSGVQKEETEDNSQNGRSYSSSYSSFRNSFSLPGPIKSEGMKVDYTNNILTVTVPKA